VEPRLHIGPFRLDPGIAPEIAAALVLDPSLFDRLGELRATVAAAGGGLQDRLRLQPRLAAFARLLALTPGAPSIDGLPEERDLAAISSSLEHLMRFRAFFGAIRLRSGTKSRVFDRRTAELVEEIVRTHVGMVRFSAVTIVVDAAVDAGGVTCEREARIDSASVARFLSPEGELAPGERRQARVALFVGTVGAELDDLACAMARAHPLRALLVHGLGAAAAELLAEDLSLRLAPDLPGPGRIRRFHVGYGDWSVLSHEALFSRLRPEAIGMSLTSAGVMVPEKSVSGLAARRAGRVTLG
jgi:hypothetical protein